MNSVRASFASYWQSIQHALFPQLEHVLGPLTGKQQQLVQTLEVIRIEHLIPRYCRMPGRPPKDRAAMARAFVAKAVYDLPTTRMLLDRLDTDVVLRRVCGWERRGEVPSESVFSRAFAEFAATQLPQRVHEALIRETHHDRLVGHLSRDSTAIEAREKPATKEKAPPPPKRKRGRPKKGEEQPKVLTRLERQPTMHLPAMLDDLPTACDVGTKKNSKGYKDTWVGYKLHIDVADGQIPISCLLTSASLHDSQAAIPLATLSAERTTNLYDLMDAAYDAEQIREHSRSLGHVPLIDVNPRGDKARAEELRTEARRLKNLGFQLAEQVRSPQRSDSQAIVTTEPIADRAVCPSRQFGSEANGRYRLLLNEDRSAIDSIFRSVGVESRNPTIVLHFGCLGASRDEIRKRATREHRLFVVVDESLVLFLAARASNRLSALFRCTLPYSAAQPYATTSSLVPQELFYGRRRERETIMDQSGACFIYGGRQLGKTALLRQVEKDFGSDDRVAKWIDLKVNEIDRAPDVWRVVQRALRPSRVVRGDREIDPENTSRVESLLRQIREWLDGRDTRRLLLLLDEADHFLLLDSENDFRESARLKGLMDETNRRFKVVFAGLHNVLRTTRHANHPLAHLGDPICVGAMTSNGEWKEAQALVREPLQAVGCRFGRDDLSTRILAHTNYYPSLIQLYGDELTRRLRDSDRAFPYAIDDDAIDDAYASRELRDAIRERFLLTLQLDQRYEVISYALAHELKEGADLDQGLTRDRILEEVTGWWPEGFGSRNLEFDMLLQEMEGLGVLRKIEPDRYTLRNPNILLLLGNREDFEKALTQERRPEQPYAPASFRARYPNDSHTSARRGPLTRQQESELHRGGVGVICGCPAAGLEDVQEFLSLRIGSDEFSRIEPAANAGEFERQLRKLRSVRNSVTVRLVPPTIEWDGAWVRASKRVLEEKAQGKRLWNRVAFIATPDQLWRLLTDAADLDGVDWFLLGPCDLTFLQRWLADINATADTSEAENFRRISGGWPVELERFGRKRSARAGRPGSRSCSAKLERTRRSACGTNSG